MKRIADLRDNAKTMHDAEQIMETIAHLECEIAYSVAHRNNQIQRARERHTLRTNQAIADLGEAVRRLEHFIGRNRDMFDKPRKHVTDFGSFGLETVTSIEFDTQEKCIEELKERGYFDCLKIGYTPIKAALKKRLNAEETIPHCTLKTGDTAVYKTAKNLLDEAKEKATQ